MKNQNGITLVSLTIYIIGVTVVISMLTIISTFFYKNVEESQNDIDPLTEFTNFNAFFSEDANRTNITYLATGKSGTNTDANYYSYIAFYNYDSEKTIKYVYVKKDNAIYRNTNEETITVARNVTNCEFEEGEQTNNNKTKFNISLTIANSEKQYSYSLDNN